MNAIIRRTQNMDNRRVLLLLVGIALTSLFFSLMSHGLAGGINLWSWADEAFQNFSTEIMGAIVTFGLFELVLGEQRRQEDETHRREEEARRQKEDAKTEAHRQTEKEKARRHLEKEEAEKEKKKRLIIQMRDQNNAIVRKAVEELRAHDWLNDGSLQDANLRGANWQGMDLRDANLQGVDLRRANLQYANLADANLAGANLISTQLEGADLHKAQLKGARLPDGRKWTLGINTKRFTDSNHPDFWTAAENE